MSEFIKAVPEHQTTPERKFWEKALNTLATLHTRAAESDSVEINNLGEPVALDFDLFETIDQLRDEGPDDMATLILNYALMIETPAGSSTPEDKEVQDFLNEYGVGEDDE